MSVKQENRISALETEKLELELWKLKAEKTLIEKSPTAFGDFMYIGVIREEEVHSLIQQMDTWSHAHPGESMTLTINSQGGVVIDGFALYDFLQRLRKRGHHLTTIGLGIAASFGAVLLQAGDDRVLTKRSKVMLHEVQGIAEGSFSELQNVMEFNKELQDDVLDILAERCNWTRAKVKSKWKDDLWLGAQDALKMGLIDRIEE